MADTFHTTLIGTGADGTSPCAMLTLIANGRRVLLNATEGLQRLSMEHGLRLHRDLDAVVLSSLRPDAVAGLPGLLLLMGDSGIPNLHVIGPPGTANFVRSLSRFVQPRTLVLASETAGDEAISWHGLVDIFALPVNGTAASATGAARRWLQSTGQH